jgi:DNA-binding IclR family transcriptional regulator
MVERITRIMDIFAHPMAALSLEEITRESGLPRSTTHRILDQLVSFGWISHIDSLYSLGQRSMGLGARELVYNRLRSASHGRLHELAHRTGLVVHLAALDGSQVYYVDKFGGPAAARRVPSEVGGRAPAHCTALGKAILAQLPPEKVHEHYAGVACSPRTGRSIADMFVLHRELARVRARHGMAFERGECFADISCAGTAVYDSRGVAAGISVVAEYGAPVERLAPLLLETARAISRELISADAVPAQARIS